MNLARITFVVLALLDTQTPTPVIAGRVVDASTGSPIAGVVVTLAVERRGSEAIGESTLSDSAGRFLFRGRELGRNDLLAALKPGYQDGRYGRSNAGLVDAKGEVVIQLVKWASIAGVVVDEVGEPVVGVPVRALSEIHLGGNPVLVAGPIASTDDRGVFRIPRLPAGVFLIQVPSVKWAVSKADADAFRPTPVGSAIQRTTSLNGPALAFGDSRLILSPYPSPPPQRPGERRRSYGATFAPSSNSVTTAARVKLSSGEDRRGVDIVLVPQSAFRLTGTVVGRPDWIAGAVARLVRLGEESLGVGSEEATALVQVDGRFEFLDVLPGEYLVSVRETTAEVVRGAAAAISLPSPPGLAQGTTAVAPLVAAPPGASLAVRSVRGRDEYFGAEPVTVTDRDEEGVSVVLHETLTVRGRIVMDGPNPGPPVVPLFEPASGRVDLAPAPLPRIAQANGDFEVSGLRPTAYRLRLPRVAGWAVVAVEVDGQRLQGDLIDLANGPPREFSAIAAPVQSGATGEVIDGSGHRVASGVAVLFPASESEWANFGFSPSNIAAAEVAQGAFQFTAVPPGDYYVAWSDTLPEDWRHAGVLAALARGATKLTIRKGEVVQAAVRVVK